MPGVDRETRSGKDLHSSKERDATQTRLRRINGDTSWLLTLPTAHDSSTSTFNILIDPWLDPAEQVDFSRAFSAQQRVTPALATSVAALEQLIAEETNSGSDALDDRPVSKQIDAIVLSHPFTDHSHPETLVDPTFPQYIPILVTSDAYNALPAKLKDARQNSQKVCILEQAHPAQPALFSSSKSDKAILPANIAVLQTRPHPRFPAVMRGPPAMASQQLHGGVFFLWSKGGGHAGNKGDDGDVCDDTNVILYTPHGSVRSSVPDWIGKSPFKPCAILTSLDRIALPSWISGTVNLGLPGALDLLLGTDAKASKDAASQAATTAPFAARYLIDTHGEHKTKQGLVASLMRRYYLGKPDDELDCSVQSTSSAKALLQEKEANRQTEAQGAVDAAIARKSNGVRCIAVHCLAVGETVALP